MENSFGEFLRQKRQEKGLTQKALGRVLFVSESCVSKWEKDVAHPDITLLPKLAEILGVTEHELLTASIDKKLWEEKRQAKKWRAFSLSWSLFFYISYIVALVPCFICNLAINKGLTWFWIVFSALLLAFTFTNLPKLIKRHKLILVPLSMFIALCILLATCAIYTRGDWFFVAILSVFLGLAIIFTPIYIAHYKIFSKIKKYNDFISIAVDFIIINILLIVINIFTLKATNNWWYLKIALPIVTIIYLELNVILSVRFLKLGRFFKSGIILTLINLFLYIPPMLIRLKDAELQKELIDDSNILKANLSSWKLEAIDSNIHCIIFLTIAFFAITFFTIGLIRCFANKAKP